MMNSNQMIAISYVKQQLAKNTMLMSDAFFKPFNKPQCVALVKELNKEGFTVCAYNPLAQNGAVIAKTKDCTVQYAGSNKQMNVVSISGPNETLTLTQLHKFSVPGKVIVVDGSIISNPIV